MNKKQEIIKDLKEKVVDLFKFYDHNDLKIEINCSPSKNNIKISITEHNV
jgi:hypothetical protein